MRHDPSAQPILVKLTRVSIAAQCATEGVLLDQKARIELEESMELTQKKRSFGESAYCLRADSLYHCTGLSGCTMQDSTRDSHISMSPATVLNPLKRVLGMYLVFSTHRSQLKR